VDLFALTYRALVSLRAIARSTCFTIQSVAVSLRMTIPALLIPPSAYLVSFFHIPRSTLFIFALCTLLFTYSCAAPSLLPASLCLCVVCRANIITHLTPPLSHCGSLAISLQHVQGFHSCSG
jgi:hypothetical protein